MADARRYQICNYRVNEETKGMENLLIWPPKCLLEHCNYHKYFYLPYTRQKTHVLNDECACVQVSLFCSLETNQLFRYRIKHLCRIGVSVDSGCYQKTTFSQLYKQLTSIVSVDDLILFTVSNHYQSSNRQRKGSFLLCCI